MFICLPLELSSILSIAIEYISISNGTSLPVRLLFSYVFLPVSFKICKGAKNGYVSSSIMLFLSNFPSPIYVNSLSTAIFFTFIPFTDRNEWNPSTNASFVNTFCFHSLNSQYHAVAFSSFNAKFLCNRSNEPNL